MRNRGLDGRIGVYGLLILALGISLLPVALAPEAGRRVRFFPETGWRVEGPFLDAWEATGTYQESIAINGFPMSDMHLEVSPDDGKTYQMQWFQRARYELHPGEAPPNNVQLGLLGVEAAHDRFGEPPFANVPQPAVPEPGVNWVPETQHTLREPFLTFWLKYGSWKQFGFPISEEFMETPPGGTQPYRVQYFHAPASSYTPANPRRPTM